MWEVPKLHHWSANLCEWHRLGTGFMPDGTHRFSQDDLPVFADLATFSEQTVVAESYLVKVRYERTLMGTFYGSARPRQGFAWILDMYMDGRLKLDELATDVRPLEELSQAFEDMEAGRSARTVLSFD